MADEKKTTQLGVRMPESLRRAVDREASKHNRTASDWVRLLIEDRLRVGWAPEPRESTWGERVVEWFRSLDAEIRQELYSIGQALQHGVPRGQSAREYKSIGTGEDKPRKDKRPPPARKTGS